MSKSRKSGKSGKDSILHRDIKDLEIMRSLKRLANLRVTEWELKDIPKYRVTDWELKDLPNLRVTEWELGDLIGRRERRNRDRTHPSDEDIRQLAEKLERFIRFVAKNLIDHPDLAVIKTTRKESGVLFIELILTQRDAAALIGHGGHTAAAMRNIVKNVARHRGVSVAIRIQSHEEITSLI